MFKILSELFNTKEHKAEAIMAFIITLLLYIVALFLNHVSWNLPILLITAVAILFWIILYYGIRFLTFCFKKFSFYLKLFMRKITKKINEIKKKKNTKNEFLSSPKGEKFILLEYCKIEKSKRKYAELFFEYNPHIESLCKKGFIRLGLNDKKENGVIKRGYHINSEYIELVDLLLK
jgi:hypothetical protein